MQAKRRERKKDRKTIGQFLADAQKVHGNRYDYSHVTYTNIRTKIKILCRLHGMFHQTPDGHLNGENGCPQCSHAKASKRFRFTKEQFVDRAAIIHNNKYNYNNFVYVNARTKGTIECSAHGPFQQKPAEHIYKSAGCSSCKKDKLQGRYTESYFQCNKDEQHKQGWLYGVELCDTDGTRFVKIGITAQTLYYRLRQYGKHKLIFSKRLPLYEAFKQEQTLFKDYCKYRYHPQRRFAGHTECFRKDVVPLIKTK